MNGRVFAFILVLVVLASPLTAQRGQFEWDPPGLRTVSLLSGISAGLVLELLVLSGGFWLEEGEEPPPQALDAIAHKLPTAAVAMTSSILVMNNYFRWTITGSEKWYGFVIKGTLLGGIGGALATFSTLATDGVTAFLISDSPFSDFHNDAFFYGGIAIVPSAILGGLTGLILYFTLSD